VNESVHLGRVRGISIGINWSVLVIAWLLAWGLADGILPEDAHGYTSAEYWAVALGTVVVFLASLLTHELGHSLVAQRQGVKVERITLWLFGGVAQLGGEARTPRAAFRIAVVGPLISVALGGCFAGVAVALAALSGPSIAVAALAWLAVINGVLALFNLVPAAPLDGGRVLHALVWRRTGSHGRATAIATRSGRTFGYVLIAVGTVSLAAGAIDGLWFAFLGWFLLSAARAEATHELLHGALAPLSVGDVMTPRPDTIPADTPVAAAVDDWFRRAHHSSFPVSDRDGAVVGLLTMRRLRDLDLSDPRPTVGDVAAPLSEVAIVAPDDPVPTLLERMAAAPGRDGRALVLDGGRLVGIVSSTDVQRALDLAALRSP
jgi:Zn-dependent protease/CBS domain-containing protein